VNTRIAVPADAPGLAELHMETLPGDVSDFTPLGRSVVRRFYANAIARGAATVCVAEADGAPIGFVMITPDISQLFARALLAGGADIARFVLTANPVGLARAVFTKLTSGTATVPAVPELVYLGVSARARGKGVGAALMDAAHAAFAAQGIESYELNVHADNPAAVKLYLGKGLEVTRRYEKGGHGMYNMRKRLGAAPGG
jgi:ribosomal protein S18 acetylase RimI-like enzyme